MKLVLVPSEQGSLGRNIGCREAPKILAKELAKAVPDFDFEPVEAKVVPADIEKTDENIFRAAKRVLGKGEKPAIFLGGDHSITYSIFRAFSARFGTKKSALLMFDAHPDCVQFFKPLSHEDFVRGLVKERLIKKENILMAGTRKVHRLEREWLGKNKIKVLRAPRIRKNPVKAKEYLSEFLAGESIKDLYITIDIDALDPAEAPGTGCREKNGLHEQELLGLLETALESGKTRAMDLVEVNPRTDCEGKTVSLAVRVLEKALNLVG